MSLSRVKVWVPGEILTAADLNGEFNNILNNPTALISPFTANINANGKQITSLALENLGASPGAGTAGRIWFNTGTSFKQVEVDDGAFIRAVPTILSSSMARGDFVTASTAGSWTKQHMAWCTFNGAATSSGLTIIDGIGVSSSANSIIQASSGIYIIPWETPFLSSASYDVQITCGLSTAMNTFPTGAVISTDYSGTAGVGQRSTACEVGSLINGTGFLRVFSMQVLAVGRV